MALKFYSCVEKRLKLKVKSVEGKEQGTFLNFSPPPILNRVENKLKTSETIKKVSLLHCLQCGCNPFLQHHYTRKHVWKHQINHFYLRGNRGTGIVLLSLHVCCCSMSASLRYLFIYLLYLKLEQS